MLVHYANDVQGLSEVCWARHCAGAKIAPSFRENGKLVMKENRGATKSQ